MPYNFFMTLSAAESAVIGAVNTVMDSTPLLISIGGVSVTVMGLFAAMLWRIMTLVNGTRIELKEDISEVHDRIDGMTEKFHAVDKEVAVLKGGCTQGNAQ